MMADTRPSMAWGVIAWRSVVEPIVHSTGPAPSKKKLKQAIHTCGKNKVALISTDARKPHRADHECPAEGHSPGHFGSRQRAGHHARAIGRQAHADHP